MKGLRAAELSDLLEIAALRRRAFRYHEHTTDEALASYYRTVFFENPWRDDRYSSLVYVGENGRIVGFIGVIPRPMVFAGRRITAVTTTEFMVAPDARGVIGPLLLRRVLNGPQELTYGDRSTDGAVALFEAFGGITIVWNSLYWSIPLDRPAVRFNISRAPAASSLANRVLGRAARSLDRLAGRLISAPGMPAGVSDNPLELHLLADSVPLFVGPGDLYPAYEHRSLAWLLERIRERQNCERVVVRQLIRGNVMIGWYICAIREGDIADLVQAAALPGEEVAVFDGLLCGIAREGVRIVHGRLDRCFSSVVVERRLPLTLAQPWVAIHSSDPEITMAFATGRVFLSRLEAEWWLGF